MVGEEWVHAPRTYSALERLLDAEEKEAKSRRSVLIKEEPVAAANGPPPQIMVSLDRPPTAPGTPAPPVLGQLDQGGGVDFGLEPGADSDEWEEGF